MYLRSYSRGLWEANSKGGRSKPKSRGHQRSSIQVKHNPTAGWFPGSPGAPPLRSARRSRWRHQEVTFWFPPPGNLQLYLSRGFQLFLMAEISIWACGENKLFSEPLKFIKLLTVKMYKALEMSLCVWLFCCFVWKQSYLWWNSIYL